MGRSAEPDTGDLKAGHFRSYLFLLRQNPGFRRFWLAGVISQIGDWFNYIGIFVLLNQLTGSGSAVSWFLIAKFLPTTLLGPVAGVVADRFSRRFILISCDLARAAVVPVYLLVRGADQVWIIYLLAFVQESIWTFASPARQATVPNLCRQEELAVANGLSGASWSIMLALGAGLGGFVSALFGWKTAIIVDALTFLVSAALLSTVTIRQEKKKKVGPLSLGRLLGLEDLVEGIGYVVSHRRVAALLLVKSGWALSGGILVMLTVFGEQVFVQNGQGAGSGVLYSMRGLGAAVGPILAWRLFGEGDQNMRRAIGAAFFISSLAYLSFSRAPVLWIGALCVFFGHVGGSIQWVFSTTLLHRVVPDRFRGGSLPPRWASSPWSSVVRPGSPARGLTGVTIPGPLSRFWPCSFSCPALSGFSISVCWMTDNSYCFW
ncbi:MFS transporter [Desulfolithobacter dissulfuricans]|nr:MFS transporter [Desulfolithobacter dissulfuricans]